MIKASEALEMVKEYQIKKQMEQAAKVKKFLDEDCSNAITTAAMNGRIECFVEIPRELCELTAFINASLCAEGYFAQTRHGSNMAVLIRWHE